MPDTPCYVPELQMSRICSPCLLLRVGQDHRLLHRLHQQLTLLPLAEHAHLAASGRALSPVAQPHAGQVDQPASNTCDAGCRCRLAEGKLLVEYLITAHSQCYAMGGIYTTEASTQTLHSRCQHACSRARSPVQGGHAPARGSLPSRNAASDQSSSRIGAVRGGVQSLRLRQRLNECLGVANGAEGSRGQGEVEILLGGQGQCAARAAATRLKRNWPRLQHRLCMRNTLHDLCNDGPVLHV